MPAEIDGRHILSDATELAFPRYPGTEGDRRAIALVAAKLGAAGLDVVEESFSYDIRVAFRALRVALIASALLAATAGVVAPGSAGIALALLTIGILAGGTLLVWAPGAERLYARPGPTETKNVTGYRRAKHPRLRLVLLAHHDSKSQNLSFPWRMGMTLMAILGGLGLGGLLIAGTLTGGLPGPGALAPFLGGLTAAALLVLSTLSSGNESPGGVDNAGSVAIVLALARSLPARVAQDVELVFLSTGAEEDHMVGAMRWLDSHAEELRACPTYAINFDGAGAAGRTVLIERYGFGRLFSATLSRVARSAAGKLGQRYRWIVMPPAMGIDAIPFAHRDVECLTLSSGRLDRAAIAVHSSGDVAAHLDAETLARIAGLAQEMVLELAAPSDGGIRD
jgi:hypothetical protein